MSYLYETWEIEGTRSKYAKISYAFQASSIGVEECGMALKWLCSAVGTEYTLRIASCPIKCIQYDKIQMQREAFFHTVS